MKRGLLSILVLAAAAVAGLWINWQLSAPSHVRNWQPLYASLPKVTENAGRYTVSNIRNWSYAPDGVPTPDWTQVTLDPTALKRVWFIVEPFSEIRAIAHTMLSFEFADGSAYVASVEARREVGEGFGGLKAGILPMHEYMFVWTTERDMFANSTFYTGDDLYMYPLELSSEAARAVLVAMLEETDDLSHRPRWYNTFLSNCTNVLARAVNDRTPGAVPWDVSWYLPGYAAAFLHEQGYIAPEADFTALEAVSLVTPHVLEVYGDAEPSEFSRRLREAWQW